MYAQKSIKLLRVICVKSTVCGFDSLRHHTLTHTVQELNSMTVSVNAIIPNRAKNINFCHYSDDKVQDTIVKCAKFVV